MDTAPPAGALVVRLMQDGIRMFHDCDDEEGVLVTPGADDKVVRLNKTSDDACRALHKVFE